MDTASVPPGTPACIQKHVFLLDNLRLIKNFKLRIYSGNYSIEVLKVVGISVFHGN